MGNPAQSRKVFKSWLSQWSHVINHVPCIGAIAPNGTNSVIVGLMRKFAQFHHPSTIEEDELDSNQFICYIATHTAEFETELEMIADYCPERTRRSVVTKLFFHSLCFRTPFLYIRGCH